MAGRGGCKSSQCQDAACRLCWGERCGGNSSKRMGVLPRLPAESLGNKVAMFWETGAQVGGGG